MLKTSGIGEFAAAWRVTPQGGPANYETALQLVAKYGWAFQQTHAFAWLRYQVHHSDIRKGQRYDADQGPALVDRTRSQDSTSLRSNRLKAIGAGVAVHGWLYLGGTPQNGGPPFRTIVDSGIHVGAGSDAAAVSVSRSVARDLLHGHRARISAGEMINPGAAVDAPGSAAAVHVGKRLVHARGEQARDHRGGQTRRCRRAERRLSRSRQGVR